jgi:hypothetical protein
MYVPFLYAAVGNKDVILEVPAGARATDFASQLRSSEQSALEFVAEGNPGVLFKPYWQVGSEEFTCFPVIRDANTSTE